jgi:ketosteroid isomerase-like protein
MKTMRAALIMSFVFAAACSGPAPEEFTTKDAGTIRQQHEAFVTAFNAKQNDAILNLYAENSVFMPPNEPIIRGKDALKHFYEELFKRGATNLRMDIAEVSGHGPLAYQSGNYEMDLKPDTGTPGRDRGKYLFVLRKMQIGWKYEYTMWNSDLPPAK